MNPPAYRRFYEHSYAERGSAQCGVNTGVIRSYSVHGQAAELRQDHIALVTGFIDKHNLTEARVLEVGAGGGGCKDRFRGISAVTSLLPRVAFSKNHLLRRRL